MYKIYQLKRQKIMKNFYYIKDCWYNDEVDRRKEIE